MSMELSKEKYPTRDLALKKHTYLIYDTFEERQRMVVPYLCAGLANQEKCLYIMDHNIIPEITAGLDKQGVNAWTLQNHVSFFPIREAFLFESQFDPYQATLFLTEQARQANREGYAALRFCCEMGGIVPYISDTKVLVKYETLLNRFIFCKYNCTALCLYEARQFQSELLLEVEAVHAHPPGKSRPRYEGLMLEANR
ncbi:MAG TPA: MEDS domain-containing protein [Syntrophomonadaceae bacterium]|nr:MEDS domain-containing protein [Syntrophomonadaceae bacterium]